MRPLAALLLIEDETVRSAISFALEVEGIDVRICSDTMQPHTTADTEGVCLVVDEGRNGAEALAWLEARQKLGLGLPTIVLVSTPSKAQRERLSAMGAVILEKPLLGQELAEAIRALAACRPASGLHES